MANYDIADLMVLSRKDADDYEQELLNKGVSPKKAEKRRTTLEARAALAQAGQDPHPVRTRVARALIAFGGGDTTELDRHRSKQFKLGREMQEYRREQEKSAYMTDPVREQVGRDMFFSKYAGRNVPVDLDKSDAENITVLRNPSRREQAERMFGVGDVKLGNELLISAEKQQKLDEDAYLIGAKNLARDLATQADAQGNIVGFDERGYASSLTSLQPEAGRKALNEYLTNEKLELDVVENTLKSHANIMRRIQALIGVGTPEHNAQASSLANSIGLAKQIHLTPDGTVMLDGEERPISALEDFYGNAEQAFTARVARYQSDVNHLQKLVEAGVKDQLRKQQDKEDKPVAANFPSSSEITFAENETKRFLATTEDIRGWPGDSEKRFSDDMAILAKIDAKRSGVPFNASLRMLQNQLAKELNQKDKGAWFEHTRDDEYAGFDDEDWRRIMAVANNQQFRRTTLVEIIRNLLTNKAIGPNKKSMQDVLGPPTKPSYAPGDIRNRGRQ